MASKYFHLHVTLKSNCKKVNAEKNYSCLIRVHQAPKNLEISNKDVEKILSDRFEKIENHCYTHSVIETNHDDYAKTKLEKVQLKPEQINQPSN